MKTSGRRGPGAGVFLAAGGAALLLVLALAVAGGAQRAPSAPPAAQAPAPHFVAGDAARRTLVVAQPGERLPGTSNEQGFLMGQLRGGAIPDGAREGVVLTDSNCEPDADGISHCLNDVQVGSVIVTVQHHHDMRLVACLTPGETVSLLPLAQYQ